MADGGRNTIYSFEGFRADRAKRLVFDERGEPLHLMPKAVEILFYLIENAGKVVEKDELMSNIWPDTIVEENNLTQNISALRRALGEKHRENRFIATVPGRGYKFVAQVHQIDSNQNERSTSIRENVDEPPPICETAANRRPWLIGLSALILIAIVATSFVVYRDRLDAAAEPIDSIAVLPFKPITAENRDEALEVGMADTLISKLSGGDRLRVRPLAAVRRYASPEQDPIEAGRQLGVEAVLDGGVQIAGGRVRVSAKLIRVSDGRQMWSGRFDEHLTDIFDVQDSISEKVSDALRIPLSVSSKKTYTENVEAYQLYMKGTLHSRRLILPEVQKGIAYFEQAIAGDPGYALAYVELAIAYRAMVLTNESPPNIMMPKAKAAAQKAVELDPMLAEAWTALAFVDFWFDFDSATAERNQLKALSLNPNNPQSHFTYAHLLSNLGRHEEALEEIKRAREADPLSLVTNALEGQILTFAGREDEALKVLQSTIDMDPNFWLGHLFISRVHMQSGRFDDAIAAAAKARARSGGNSEAAAVMAYAYARSGRPAEARKILAELEDRAKTRYVPAYSFANIYLGLGDRSKALDLLEKAFEQRESLLVFLKVERKWDELRGEPRFAALIRRVNLEK